MEFIPNDNLFIIREDCMTNKFVQSFEGLHGNFPNDICYIVDDEEFLTGIFSLREFKESCQAGEPCINRSFTFFDENTDVSEPKLETWSREHQNILNVPVVASGKLKGEFRFHDSASVKSFMEWDELGKEVSEKLSNIAPEKSTPIIAVTNDAIWDDLKLSEDGFIKEVSSNSQEVDYLIYDMDSYHRKCQADLLRNGFVERDKDSVSLFDLYLDCLIRHCVNELILHGVDVYYFGAPTNRKISNLSDRDAALLLNPESLDYIAGSPKALSEVFDSEYDMKSREYIERKEADKVQFILKDGYYGLLDYRSATCNIINGKRLTYGIPSDYENSIHVYGVCTARGYAVADQDTIPSMLQRLLNERQFDRYAVVNCGVAEGIIGAALNDFQYILHTTFKSGDVVMCVSEYPDCVIELMRDLGVRCYETSSLFESGHEYGRWFLDLMAHLNVRGNKAVAEFIFDKLAEGGSLRERVKEKNHVFNLVTKSDIEHDDKLKRQISLWAQSIKDQIGYSRFDNNDVIGAIVMNCNPFTNGHRFLIDYARQKVDRLIVFVVEEDRSIFKFKDRIQLVRKGTSEFKNVYVVPSGRFIISTETFPEYFNKANLQDVEIDPSSDVAIFANYIAPEFHITSRFVGEEPFDTVTESYNRAMTTMLSTAGISFEVIPRKSIDGTAVSASHVRRLLDAKEWEQIEKLVPVTTYDFLIRNWG